MLCVCSCKKTASWGSWQQSIRKANTTDKYVNKISNQHPKQKFGIIKVIMTLIVLRSNGHLVADINNDIIVGHRGTWN